ncbi:hypothetical protein [Winogradskyella bathintestinalis]|uniref:STAS/SEC14 domain-containing protein n=1 Tax=Winogradskyella bathintestinalis TaxID=3035208 RepID=A0ABT7ZTR0_9FLAO|nr:hypothetical protein [Winogradskyella bathintestinalis]MDN3492392.1 hypothetical protein [Winogradskyella bathintestinalis]
MVSIKQTCWYNEVLTELNYKFGNVFIFGGFVISEINEGVCFSWENHGKLIVDDVIKVTKNESSDLIYISHKINSYSVDPWGWLGFFRSNFNLNGYGVIGYTSHSFVNTVIESLFFKHKINRFSNLETAINWAKEHNCKIKT